MFGVFQMNCSVFFNYSYFCVVDMSRRSGASGFLLPLSGGADSASVAGIVRVMCVMLADAVAAGDKTVTDNVIRIVGDPSSSTLAP